MALPGVDTRVTAWYTEDPHSLTSKPTDDFAEQAFREALLVFKTSVTKDPAKIAWLDQLGSTGIEDVRGAVEKAKNGYEIRSEKSKLRRRLASLARSILYYGQVMDVLVQHHPEYVSLAWGAMKLLVMGVAEQENLLSTLAKGLNKIADSLPRAEISARLYPIPRMKTAVARLYVNIIKFLVRAFNWYNESKLRHVYHAFTRPAALAYDDLISDVEETSKAVTELALISGQAEQRDIHLELRTVGTDVKGMSGTLSQLHQIIVDERMVNASARQEIQQALCEIRISKVFDVLSTNSSLDPQKSYTASRFLRARRRMLVKSKALPFWDHVNLQKWNNQKSSALVLVKGSIRRRSDMKDFCVDIVEYLQNSKVAVLWILQGLDQSLNRNTSIVDLLKNLTLQVLRIRSTQLSSGVDPVVAQQLHKFLNAQSESDWLVILASILNTFSVAYIVIDAKAISSVASNKLGCDSTSLLHTFSTLLDHLSANTTLKIIITDYGCSNTGTSSDIALCSEKRHQQYLVDIGKTNQRSSIQARRGGIKNLYPEASPKNTSFSLSSRELPRRSRKKKRS